MIVKLQSQVIKLVLEVTYKQHNGCSQLLSLRPHKLSLGFKASSLLHKPKGEKKLAKLKEEVPKEAETIKTTTLD